MSVDCLEVGKSFCSRTEHAQTQLQINRDEASIMLHNIGVCSVQIRAVLFRLVLYFIAFLLMCTLHSCELMMALLFVFLASLACWHSAVHICFPCVCATIFPLLDLIGVSRKVWSYRAHEWTVLGIPLWVFPLYVLAALGVCDINRCIARLSVRLDARAKRSVLGSQV